MRFHERRRLDEVRNVLLAHEHQARTAAEDLIRAKDQFLATISLAGARRHQRDRHARAKWKPVELLA